MRVLFVTSEITPFSKTGGLADVSEALPAALAGLGCEVSVVSPLYRGAAAALERLALPVETCDAPPVPIAGIPHPLQFRVVQRGGCALVFAVHDGFYDRRGLYGVPGGGDYGDNVARFTFLCRAALAWGTARGGTDILHANDWQTALSMAYLRAGFGGAPFAGARGVFTVHNLVYQGHAAAREILTTGLDWSWFHPGALEYYGGLNLMKAGLVFADALTTVSPTYAIEIQSPAAGNGLDGVLRAAGPRLHGILNGIDTSAWNPATDPHLPARFEVDDLSGKAACKQALQSASGLPLAPEALLLAAIGRFDWQKGMPLICDAFRRVAPLGAQLVILGSGDPGIEGAVRELARAYPRQVAATIGFDEGLAHRIEAGADAFLMPSAYEPCGLNQMYSQRYGTVPIVHATGGLKDTVVDHDAARAAGRVGSGFSFTTFDGAHLAEAMLRAWRLYTHAPDEWRSLQRACMRLDHSWANSAREYLALYESVAAL
ncbi:MAG: glycogen synthase GlgA [Deltaproteobacteria bacterium]|nr:glycogen synthase GlgA [Deltaproteobacteria bacterium]